MAIDRRSFLSFVTAGGAYAWVTADSALAQSVPAQAFPNAVPAENAPPPVDANSYFAVDANATTLQQAQVFPLSVASGDPQPNGIVLWTRIGPSFAASGSPVMWQISAAPDFSTVVVYGSASTDAARDYTVKLPISLAQLQPFTTYYYRFIYNNVSSRTGRFKTLPAPGTPLPQLRLGYVVCQDFGNGFYNALRYLAQEPLDYVLHLGDYIYETINAPSFQNSPVRTVPPFPSGSNTVPQNLDDYRHLYQVYRGDPDQQAVHENFAYIQLWDDHEFANDCHQDFHPDNNPDPNAATPALRKAANQAWSEYGLANVAFDPAQDWEHSIRIYRKFSFGALADLVVTDQRLYRDGPPCGNNQVFERYFSLGCPAMNNTNRTMLGPDQKAWFLQQVTQSTATWKLWANEVMLMPLKIAGAVFVNLDQWDGYPAERTAILTAIGNARVNNFVALTGDLHTFLAGYLKKDFGNFFEQPIGVELMVGSISSANLAEGIEAGIKLPSCPVPAQQFGVPPNLLEPLIRVNNPHIQYWNSSTHGYGVLEITAQQMTCTFKAVTTVKTQAANLVQLKKFVLPSGQVRLHQS